MSDLEIAGLTARERVNRSDVDAFVRNRPFPLIEGTHATFVWRGDAEAVALRHGVYGLPSPQPLERVASTDLWYTVLELPPGSRVEYKFAVTVGGNSRLLEDPLNPNRCRDPFGQNSVAHGSGYVIPEWTRPDPESRRGRLETLGIPSHAFGGKRDVTLYLPARFRHTHRYPLLIVHDGGDYLAYASFETVVENLIHRLELEEMVVALLHPRDRLVEYAASAQHSRFLTHELVPLLEREYPLLGKPAGRCLMGASFGAVASFAAAEANPGFYGKLLLQSGSFAFTDIGPSRRGPVFDPVVKFVNRFRAQPTRIADRLFLSCGTYESLIYENRSMVPLLQKTGMEVRYTEANDGHNWENWRDRMREGLSWLYPGPLWMVYE